MEIEEARDYVNQLVLLRMANSPIVVDEKKLSRAINTLMIKYVINYEKAIAITKHILNL